MYSQDGKDRFFPAEQDKAALKILPLIQTGQTAILKEGRSRLRKKKTPQISAHEENTPAVSLDRTKLAKRKRGKTKAQSWPNSPLKEPQLSSLSAFCFLQTTPQQKTFPPRLTGHPVRALLEWSFSRTSGDTLPPLEKPKPVLDRYLEAVSGPIPSHKRTAYERTAQKGY